MKSVLSHIDVKTEEYAALPLFAFLRDEARPPRERMAFVPCLSHFVMSFADIYGLVLRSEPPADRYQELVNAHTYEDGGHWKWFLADLAALELNPSMPLAEALRSIWSEQTRKTRMLAYRICRLGWGATTLEKLILVHCIEAAGKVSLAAAAPVANATGRELGRKLLYFGSHHLDTEQQHTLEEDEVRTALDDVVLEAPTQAALRVLADEAFAAFQEFADELLEFALANQGKR